MTMTLKEQRENNARIDEAVYASIKAYHARDGRPCPNACIDGHGYSSLDNSLRRLKRAGRISFREGSGSGWLPFKVIDAVATEREPTTGCDV